MVKQNGHKEEETRVSGSLLVHANQPWVICSCWQLQLPLTSGEKKDGRAELTHWWTSHFWPDLKKKYSRVSPFGPVRLLRWTFSLLLPLFIFNESLVDSALAYPGFLLLLSQLECEKWRRVIEERLVTALGEFHRNSAFETSPVVQPGERR